MVLQISFSQVITEKFIYSHGCTERCGWLAHGLSKILLSNSMVRYFEGTSVDSELLEEFTKDLVQEGYRPVGVTSSLRKRM